MSTMFAAAVNDVRAPRVAWLHSHLLLWTGGTRFILEVARRVNQTVPVDMLVERCAPHIRELFERAGVRVIELNARSSTSKAYWALFPAFLARDVYSLRKERKRYTAFISSMFPMANVAQLAGAQPLLSYVFEPFAFFHDDEMIAGFPPIERRMLRALAAVYKRLDVAGIHRSDRLLTVNHGTEAWVQRVYGRDATPTFLGVDCTAFAPMQSRFAERYAGRKVIVHSTDFTPLKRTDLAVEIMSEVKREVPDAKLLITCSSGSDDKIAALNRSIQEKGLAQHAEVVGYVPIEDLAHYYALADVALYTGIGRGASAASLFVLECMASGTPGVRTNFTDDEVEHGVSGFLFAPDDRGALLRHLVQLLTDDELRKRFGAAARARVVERYSWDSVAARFVSTLSEMGVARR